MRFAQQLAAFGDEAERKADQAIRKVALGVFDRVIMRTPVDTGRLRGNWQASVGKPATGIRRRPDANGPVTQNGSGSSTAKDRAQKVVLGANSPTVFYLTNNLPYATVIEYESRSQQAPQGMVRISAAEFQDLVREVTGA